LLRSTASACRGRPHYYRCLLPVGAGADRNDQTGVPEPPPPDSADLQPSELRVSPVSLLSLFPHQAACRQVAAPEMPLPPQAVSRKVHSAYANPRRFLPETCSARRRLKRSNSIPA